MNSFISWIGGKKLLRKQIISQFPREVDRYIEVFGGAGWVLFGKGKGRELEVFNDIDGELINLYRCVKYHCKALQEELAYSLSSREIFYTDKERIKAKGTTDIQRAAAYFRLIRTSFGSDRRSFNTSSRRLSDKIEYLSEISQRLESVVIENKDFQNLMEVYDRKNALFYLDPPYYKSEKYYDEEFGENDHIRLLETLKKIKGKWILSYNNHDRIKEMYREFQVVEIGRFNNLSNRSREYKELIIKNY